MNRSLDLELDNSQYADRADTASLSITGDLTIECWIKPKSTGTLHSLFAKWDTTGNLRSYRFLHVSATRLQFQVSVDGTTPSGSGQSNTDIPTGVWAHVAVSYNAAVGTCIFYLNGVVDGTASSFANSIQDNASKSAIGCSDAGGTPTDFLDGLIDEVRIWNVERTAAQILANYNKELLGNESGLAAYYKFNSSYGDYTTNGNNLTAVAGTVFSTDTPFAVGEAAFII